MSMTYCNACDKLKDSDFIEFETIDGKEICESCLSEIPEPVTMTYWPTECAECGRPTTQGSPWCSERCRKIAVGEPTHAEQMADL